MLTQRMQLLVMFQYLGGLRTRQQGYLYNPSTSVEHFQTGLAVVVAQAMPAYYLHVDDAVFWSTKAEDGLCNQLVETAASSLRNIGFTVTDVQHSSEAKKAIGFVLEQEPSKLVLTRERMAALYGSLCWLVEIDMVDTVVLRSVLGVWIWAATLGREQS